MAHQLLVSHFHIWIQLLWKNGFNWKRIPQVLLITLITFLLIPFHLCNELIFQLKKSKLPKTPDPIFIIGHWRSGTTLLQYMMCLDPMFGYLTYYQAFVPTLAFIGGNGLKRILAPLIPSRRPQDDVQLHADLPTEEENPLATFSTQSASHSFFFPKNESYYNRFILFKNTSVPLVKKWQKAYQKMIDQISTKWPGKQLVIKNPHNTGRVLELKAIYPNAKFVFLHRNPYEVFPSTYLMYDKVVKTQYLQKYSKTDTEDKIFFYYQSIIQKYLEQRSFIPPGDIIEIAYDDLTQDPLTSVKRIYEHFDLELSREGESRMSDFVKSQKSYRINQHNLSEDLSGRISNELSFVFEEFDYPT